MISKLSEVQIYRDPDFFSAFPAIVNLGNGEMIAAFRRTPRYRGLPGLPDGWCTHLDMNSKLFMVRSHDGGQTWGSPRLVYAPDEGAAQDAGLFYDGKLLLANTFVWGNVPGAVFRTLKETGQDEYILYYGGSTDVYAQKATHVGCRVLESKDLGRTWETPVSPEPLPGYPEALPGHPLRMHNRGNIIRMPDGRLLYAGQALHYNPYRSAIVLYESRDEGHSWQYLAMPAPDYGMAVMEEPSITLTPSGKLVILIRCHKTPEGHFHHIPEPDGPTRAHLWRTESSDGGKNWSTPQDLGFHGEPPTAAVLEDGRVLVAYGYRVAPYGVRCRICNSDMSNLPDAEEFIIRDDNDGPDCGYPWIAPLGNKRYMVAYYINHTKYDGAGGIFGTLLEIR